MKIKKKRVTINMDEEILKKIDKKRNGIPRSVFINKILKRYIERRLREK